MSWLGDVLAALETRDAIEQSVKGIVDKYAILADRTVTAHSKGDTAHRDERPPDGNAPDQSASLVARQTRDLIEAQRQRADLQTRTSSLQAELEQHRARANNETRRINDLTADRKGLATRLKDLDEEIRAKNKLLDDVHDETVALTLQLNILEENNKNLRKENDELVNRWMVRMGQEAEAMNKASEFQ